MTITLSTGKVFDLSSPICLMDLTEEERIELLKLIKPERIEEG